MTGVALFDRRTASPEAVRRWPALLVGASATLFVFLYGTLVVWNYHSFRVLAFDFGIFDQALWLLSEGREPFITIRGLHLLGDHSSYILFLLAPLYWIAPHQEVLLVLSVIALAAGAPLTYAIARRFGAGQVIAAVVGVTYLLQPALAWSARDNFHPEILAIPLVLGGLLALQTDRDIVGFGLLMAALLSKEDAALLLAPLGLYLALVMGKRRFGFGLAALASVMFFVHFAVLLPHFSPTGDLIYNSRYDHLGDGISGVLTGLLTRPGVVVEGVSNGAGLGYLAAMVLPMPLAVIAPRLTLVGLPAFLANVLSTHTYQAEIRWHYTTYLIVVLAMASARGSAWLSGVRPNRAAIVALISVALAFHLVLAPNPVFASSQWTRPSQVDPAMAEAVEMIPEEATVSAMSPFVAHLSHRQHVYNFPNPFQRHNYGAGPDGEMPDPGSVEWVAILTDRYEDMQPIVRQLLASDEFEIRFKEGPVVMLSRH